MVRRNLEPWQQSRILAVSIACPGVLEDDRLVTAVNLGWRRFPLLDTLSEAISIPVFLSASCRAHVLAEQGVGSARNTSNCVYVELGKGIGAGIVIDRRYLEGNTTWLAGTSRSISPATVNATAASTVPGSAGLYFEHCSPACETFRRYTLRPEWRTRKAKCSKRRGGTILSP